MSEMKRMTIGVAMIMLLATGLLVSVRAKGDAPASDPAAFYKTKCVACHGKKAEKKFDTTLPDEQLIEIVMKGKKPAKPPNMPAYAEKGVTAEQAKALVDYMKVLKSTP